MAHDSLVRLIQQAQQQERRGIQHQQKRQTPAGGAAASSPALSSARLPSASDFFVPTLPASSSSSSYGVQDILPIMYSGHLPASWSLTGSGPGGREQDAASDARLFFLLVKRLHVAERERLVIWFNGGPGCSSFDGALLEIGPVFVNGTGSNARLVKNPGRWNEYANVLFIDQPAGTGYSYLNRGHAVAELAPAADQLVNFLGNFYNVFPEYGKIDTYLAGESYAGMTVPYLAKAMLSATSLPSSSHLRGMLLGNGWFDPATQYPAYAGYARARGVVAKTAKTSKEYQNLMQVDKQCNETLARPAGQGHVLVGTCEGLIDAAMALFRKDAPKGKCVSAYDTRPSISNCGEYPLGLQAATPYLQNQQVVDAFHASAKTARWTQCNGTVGAEMWSPLSRPSVELLPNLLERMPMLLYAGDADLMCSYTGIENMLQQLTWKGSTGFGNSTAQDWIVNGTSAGTWQTARNVTWVRVFESGHMVPIDQPYAAHDILLRFLGIDALSAAGGASKIPSHVGNATTDSNAVVGKVAPDGNTLPGVKSEQAKAAAASASAAAAAVDLHNSAGQPIDKDRELYYGPRRTGVLVLILMTVILGLWTLLRWRASERRRKGWVPRNAAKSAFHVQRQASVSRWAPPSDANSPPPHLYETQIHVGEQQSYTPTRYHSPVVDEARLLQQIEEYEDTHDEDGVEGGWEEWRTPPRGGFEERQSEQRGAEDDPNMTLISRVSAV